MKINHIKIKITLFEKKLPFSQIEKYSRDNPEQGISSKMKTTYKLVCGYNA